MNGAPRSTRVSPTAFARGMRTFLVVFNLLMVAFAAWALLRARRHEVELARITTSNLAQVLEQNITGTLRQIDLALLSIKDQAETGGAQRLGAFTEAQFHRLGMIDALRIADPDGRLLHAIPHGEPTSLAGRSFFQALRLDPYADMLLSSPAHDGHGGAWAVTLARRINRPDGSFGGAVCATLATERLARAMSHLDVGRGGSVSLRGEDLGLLVRYPAFSGQENLIGDTRVSGDYREAIQSPAATAHFSSASVLDGQRRIYTLRKMDAPRLHLLVGLSERDFLRSWRHQVVFAGSAVAGLVGLTLAMGWLARSAWLRQLADQERLAREEAKYRLLADNALDVIWSTDPEGKLTYISPSILRQRGWTPGEFMQLDLRDRLFSAQSMDLIRGRIAAARSLPPGSQPFEDGILEVGVRHKDGQEIQVELRTRVVWSEDGSVLGLQGTTRDITERKRVEAERDKVIQELTLALAEVKQLSGMLPICAQCKKVRDDQGYWNQIETYLSEHTEATFTHGVCPECAVAFREEMRTRREQQDRGGHQG